MGDIIFLEEIRKSGYELVNEKDFEIVKISNTNQLGVDVILAERGVVDAAKKEYYEVSDSALLDEATLHVQEIPSTNHMHVNERSTP